MVIYENFIFTTSVSIDYYTSKNEATACLSRIGAKALGKKKMAFVKRQVTVSEFLGLATTGHCFCNLFQYDPKKKYKIETSNGYVTLAYPEYNKGLNKGAMKLSFKSDEFFYGAQTIFVDIDYTQYADIPTYLSLLTYKPTCVYMSFSDKLLKQGRTSRRFRLVYVFDKILDKTEFLHIAQVINKQVEIDTQEPLDDDCGKRMSQYMNGVFNNPEVYYSNFIYSVFDFPVLLQYSAPVSMVTNVAKVPKVEFNKFLLSDMATLSYEDFMHRYSPQYRYFYRTELEEWNACTLYQITDENYLQIWWYNEKQVDGQRRRRKLFKNACLRRLICPNVDPDTLLFNLYVDLWRFFDNSDRVITLDALKRKAKNALKMSNESLLNYCSYEIKYWKENRPLYIVNPKIPNKHSVLSYINKNIRLSKFEQNYDPFKSITDNLENLEISRSTAYRYCKERHINTNPNKGMTNDMKRQHKKNKKKQNIELFKLHFDINLSIRENKKKLESYGLKLSIGGLLKWKEKYL